MAVRLARGTSAARPLVFLSPLRGVTTRTAAASARAPPAARRWAAAARVYSVDSGSSHPAGPSGDEVDQHFGSFDAKSERADLLDWIDNSEKRAKAAASTAPMAAEGGAGGGGATGGTHRCVGEEKIAIIGSGNWGSAIARIAGQNVHHFDRFDNQVKMWVFEEEVEGRKLTEIINTEHENVKYLPGIKLPENVVAVPDLVEVIKGATMLVFVLPHQFLHRLIPQIKPHLSENAKAISLIKGIDYDEKGLVLISDIIRNGLDLDVSVLMGANVANDVARDQFAEATIGAKVSEHGEAFKDLFDTALFRVNVVTDTVGVELCGALKNVVAVGAGFCDGLGFGGNTKAAIIRIGLIEMMRFCKKFYEGIKPSTFFESCGIADLITTCFGGRNRKCAEAFVTSGKSWEALEDELLGGQKLQGTLTAVEVNKVLTIAGAIEEFPLFTMIYDIAFNGVPPEKIVEMQLHVPKEDHFA